MYPTAVLYYIFCILWLYCILYPTAVYCTVSCVLLQYCTVSCILLLHFILYPTAVLYSVSYCSTVLYRGLPINSKLVNKLIPPIFVFVSLWWFRNSFSFKFLAGLRVKNLNCCQIFGLDRSKEGFWCTECNAKNISSLQSTIPEKNKKNGQKRSFLAILTILTILARFSWFFHKRYSAESWGFLRYIQCTKTLHLSYQNQQSDNFSYFSP